MATRMQQRRGTAAQWTAANPTLAAGEIGFETDTSKFKMGNGSSNWAALTYFSNNAALTDLLDGAPDALNTLNELAAAINDNPTFFSSVSESISGSITQHNLVTTNVHGISDTSTLATTSDINDAIASVTGDYSQLAGTGIDWNSNDDRFDIDSTIATASSLTDHNSATENVHGIADTTVLATTSDVSTAQTAAETTASGYVTTHNSATTNVHGIADIADLATKSYADTAEADAITAAGTAADTKIATAVAALTKSSVGLGNVDNTSDANKPVSTATQTALDAKASLSGATFTGNVEMDGNLIVDGDLTVNGTNFSASATSITIEDNMVQLAHQNAANTVDLGIVVAYNDGSAKHAGIVRDVSDAKWKLFKDVATEPATTVAFGEGSLDDLALNNLTAAGVVFTDGTQTKEGVPSRTPIIQKTEGYTLSALTERDSLIEMSSSSGITLTIPTDATLNYPIGTTIDILQTSTGQVTIAAATPGTTTVNATPGLKLRTQWSSATLLKRAANTWVVFGDLTA
jgi:hypothetical protein